MITKFTNFQVFNTTQRCFDLLDVYVSDQRIYHLGQDDSIAYDQVIDGHGQYLIPGLIDSHMHIESSMTTPQEYSNTVLPYGITTIIADAHEVANVFGVEGLEDYMNQESQLDIYWAIPSSVPCTNSTLETTGGKIGVEEVKRLCQHPKVIALGEIMNYSDVVCEGDSLTKQLIRAFREEKPLAPIEGHIPRVTGLDLSKYLQLDICTDHTLQSVDSVLEKVRAGVLVQLQEKSLSKEIIDTINQNELISRISIVTDDVLPNDLVNDGGVDHVLRLAIKLGLKPEDAIYATTYTPAMRMNLFDRGTISAGKLADFVVLKSLDDFQVSDVYKKGVNIKDLPQDRKFTFNEASYHSIKRDFVAASDFDVVANGDSIRVRVMAREEISTFCYEEEMDLRVVKGKVMWQEAGLCLISVIERYGHNNPIKFGFVKKAFDKPCAVATSWTHDHHNILVLGSDVDDIVECVNRVIEIQGGIVFRGDEAYEIPLTYGGIVSLQPMAQVAKECDQVSKAMRDAGFKGIGEIMSLSVMGLLCSPYLKMSEHGYVDVRKQEIKSWIVE